MKAITCPHCGRDIDGEVVRAAIQEVARALRDTADGWEDAADHETKVHYGGHARALREVAAQLEHQHAAKEALAADLMRMAAGGARP